MKILLHKNPSDGLIYYRNEKGTDTLVKYTQGNLVKLRENVTAIQNDTDLNIQMVQTTDGTFTFRLISGGGNQAAGGGRSGVNVSDEGILQGFAKDVNFVGAGVEVSFSRGIATVTIGGGMGGSGTLNYITKFTPDGSTLGNSSLYDNGSIGYGTAAPDASSTFDIQSTTKGFLVPRMTTAQRNAIAAPTDGLLVYNTSTKLFTYWDSTASTWQNIDSQAGGDVSGSGTTGYVPYWSDGPNSVISNSIMFYDLANSRIGISTATPSAKFQINGNGATSATYGLQVHNSTGTNNALIVRDDGRVGVGTASPTSTLHAYSSDGTTSPFNVQNNNTTNVLYCNPTDSRVVIGGTSIDDPIFGAGTIDFKINDRFNFAASGSNRIFHMNNGTVTAFLSVNTGPDKAYFGTYSGHDLSIRTNNADWVYLTSDQKFGIGITSGLDARLHIKGSGATSATYALKLDNSASTSLFYVRNDGYIAINGRLNEQQGADVASANDLTLGLDGNTFEITGATQINAITTANWQNGSKVTLLFTSNPTVKYNTAGGAGTAVILLAGAADFAATAGDTLTLVLSEIGGTQAWREVARAVI